MHLGGPDLLGDLALRHVLDEAQVEDRPVTLGDLGEDGTDRLAVLNGFEGEIPQSRSGRAAGPARPLRWSWRSRRERPAWWPWAACHRLQKLSSSVAWMRSPDLVHRGCMPELWREQLANRPARP